MSKCQYCNSKKMYVQHDRHKCVKREEAVKEKMCTFVLPIILDSVRYLIEEMTNKGEAIIPILSDQSHLENLEKYEEKRRLINLDVGSKWVAYTSNAYHSSTKYENKQEMIDAAIKNHFDYWLYCFNPFYILKETPKKIALYIFTEFGKDSSSTKLALFYRQLMRDLTMNGVDMYKNDHNTSLSGTYHSNFERLHKIEETIISQLKDEEQSPEPPKISAAPTTQSNVVLYLRVSTSGQCADGQNQLLLEFCIKKGIRVQMTYEDVGSARVIDNTNTIPAFSSMITCVKENTCILVWSVDRFGRNVKFVENALDRLHKKNCYVYSVCGDLSSHDPSFMEKIQEAETESNNKSEKAKMIASYKNN